MSMNKKNRVLEGIAFGFVVVLIIVGYVFTAYNEQNYTRQGHLVRESQYVYLFYDNNTDNVFAFESDDIIKDNTEVIVYMNTNNTTTIYDDIIKELSYNP